jgi:MFS family permease
VALGSDAALVTSTHGCSDRTPQGFRLPRARWCRITSGAGGAVPTFGIVLLGIAAGTEIDMLGYLSSRYFGLRHFGQLYGYIFAVFSAGAALGPYVLGVCFDQFHSYNDALFGYVGLLVLASGLIVSLGAYVFPVESDADVRLASAVRTPT